MTVLAVLAAGAALGAAAGWWGEPALWVPLLVLAAVGLAVLPRGQAHTGALDWLVWTFFAQGTMPHDAQMRQLELFATKVWPDFR